MRIAVVGDTMLDVDLAGDAEALGPDAPVPVLSTRSTRRRPGAAGFVATLLADDGIEVELITALSDDARAEELKHMLAPWPRRPHGPISINVAARALGDCLIVFIEGDASAGAATDAAQRVMSAQDRRDLLMALACVDAVIVFEESDPRAALDRIRPDVFVKADDADVIPEEPLVGGWGGRVVTVPFRPIAQAG